MSQQESVFADTDGRKIYFASDFHLGIPDYLSSLKREKLLVQWLNEIRRDAYAIYLMGDVFDFWFEYKTVVQKGYTRLLGKLAEITDAGIPVHLFRGNHDVWAFDYLEKELGISLYRQKQITSFGGKTFFLAHGDGLGPGDKPYKFMKNIFENRINQWLFRWIHPDIGSLIARNSSDQSRYNNTNRQEKYGYPPIESEQLYQYSLRKAKQHPEVDFFIFGHRHRPTDIALNDNVRLIILGDWVCHYSYAVFDGKQVELKYFRPANSAE